MSDRSLVCCEGCEAWVEKLEQCQTCEDYGIPPEWLCEDCIHSHMWVDSKRYHALLRKEMLDNLEWRRLRRERIAWYQWNFLMEEMARALDMYE